MTCRCGHAKNTHSGTGKCLRILCGCDQYRPSLPVADEAEAWLAGREAPGEDAARDGEVA
jgi:hypothetical protein